MMSPLGMPVSVRGVGAGAGRAAAAAEGQGAAASGNARDLIPAHDGNSLRGTEVRGRGQLGCWGSELTAVRRARARSRGPVNTRVGSSFDILLKPEPTDSLRSPHPHDEVQEHPHGEQHGKENLAASFALAAGLAVSVALPPGVAAASPPGTKDVTAVLFEWNFDSVAKECTNTLGPAGYGYVQVSPPADTYRARSGGPRTSP